MTSSTRLTWTRTLTLILLAVAVGCASSPPPPPPPVDYGPNEAAVRARLGELERQGAAAFLPGDFAALTERVARASGAQWVALEQELPAFAERLAAESAARAGQARADLAAVTAQRDLWQGAESWQDCPWAVAAWRDAGVALAEAEAGLARVEAEPAASLTAIAAADRAESALAATAVEGVRCRAVVVASDTAPQLLAAAAVVLAGGRGGDAAGLLAAVVELDPAAAAAAEAKAGLGQLTPEVQARTRAAVDEAVAACDRDLAKHRLAVFVEMLAVVAKHAPEQVDPALGGERARLEEAIRAMTASCGLAPDHEELDAALARELDGLLKAGKLTTAEGKLAGFASAELRGQYQRRIAVEQRRVAVRDAVAAGDLDAAIALCGDAPSGGVPAAACAEALLARARQGLAARALAQATTDAREAVRLQSNKTTKAAAAEIFAEVGRQATAKGDGKAAVGALEAALELSDDATTRAALAAALAGEGDYAAAGRHLETALARGATVDLTTRLSIQLVGAVLSGDQAAMERAVRAVQGEGGSGGKTGDLAVHALRIGAYLDLGPRAAAAAGSGGSIRSGLGCMVFAGSSRGDAGGVVAAAIATARTSGIGFSPDLRYCAVVDRGSGAAAVFDARAGNLGKTVQRAGVPSDVALAAAVGAVDVACSALPFLAQQTATALAAGGGRDAVQQRLDALARTLLGRTFAFVGVADAMGRTVSWATAAGGPTTAGAAPARVPTPGGVEVVATTVGGRSFLEVAAPIDDRGSMRGVLRAGIEADAARAGRLSCGG